MNVVALVTLIVGLLVGLALGTVIAGLLARSHAQANAATIDSQLAQAAAEVSAAKLEASTARAEVANAHAETSRAHAAAAEARAETDRVRADVANARTHAAERDADVAQSQALAAAAIAEKAEAQAQLAAARAERDAAISRAAGLAADRESLVNQFKALSGETIEHQLKQSDQVAEQRLKATADLMAPVTESLRLMNERLNQVEVDRASATAEMREQIKSVQATGESMRKETNSLVTALRKPQVRGTWGETQLKRVAELAGMVERCDFDLQASTTTEDGRWRPDMRVNLADGKVVFVDSKVPLSAFLDAYEAADDDLRQAHLATFARHVRTHIEALSGKQYWKLDAGSPEFVILFLPNDAFLQVALDEMPDLHEFAGKRNVTLASPSILIPLLRTVAHTWKQAALAESAEQVAALGRELYERLTTMGTHFDRVGRSLGQAVKAYNSTLGSLETRVMVTARKFNALQVVGADLPTAHPVEETLKSITAVDLAADMAPDEAAPQLMRGAELEQFALTRGEPSLDDLLSCGAGGGHPSDAPLRAV